MPSDYPILITQEGTHTLMIERSGDGVTFHSEAIMPDGRKIKLWWELDKERTEDVWNFLAGVLIPTPKRKVRIDVIDNYRSFIRGRSTAAKLNRLALKLDREIMRRGDRCPHDMAQRLDRNVDPYRRCLRPAGHDGPCADGNFVWEYDPPFKEDEP